MPILVGVDFGSEGGACAIDISEGGTKLVSAIAFDAASASDILHFISCFKGSNVYTEKVGSTPGDGVKSLFSFGRNVGRIQSLLELAKNPIFEVSPVMWSAYYRGLYGSFTCDNKERNIQLAKHILGEEVERLHKSKLVSPRCSSYHTGAVDSFLIANFAALSHHKIISTMEAKRKQTKSKAPKAMFI